MSRTGLRLLCICACSVSSHVPALGIRVDGGAHHSSPPKPSFSPGWVLALPAGQSFLPGHCDSPAAHHCEIAHLPSPSTLLAVGNPSKDLNCLFLKRFIFKFEMHIFGRGRIFASVFGQLLGSLWVVSKIPKAQGLELEWSQALSAHFCIGKKQSIASFAKCPYTHPLCRLFLESE